MDRWVGKVALVTGASSGIGAGVTEALAKAGLKVVAAARREDRLRELQAKVKGSKGAIYPKKCDVSKEEDVLEIFRWIEKELGGVDLVVNNAGVLYSDTIEESSTEKFRQILGVNVLGTATCCREAIRSLKKRDVEGQIINVNSIAGHYAQALFDPLSIYPASKYAITGMTASLINELALQKSKIKVTSISPGAVYTDMIKNAGFSGNIFSRYPILEAQEVVDAILYVVSTPPNVQITELTLTGLKYLA
ncbi:farnesol dehydrogenase [Orussus abietinus]|uniref:farnesol dehydrogenase n=1 Tax=Orussus abietinus TaxID=222816 RepID=UPI0006260F87|nr:farnesol dehydrogenase [Orussus abietinus]